MILDQREMLRSCNGGIAYSHKLRRLSLLDAGRQRI